MKLVLPLVFGALLTLTAAAQPAKIRAIAAKKIADSMPAPLAQSPADGRPRTDAQDENLRGKVKSVAYRFTDAGSSDYPKLRLMREDFYDGSGNRVRGVDWDDTWPTVVTVFGYIEGMRVSRSRIVEYAAGERPPTATCIPLVHSVVEPEPPGADERYGIRWVYKYDPQGRLVDETHLNNRGAVLTRTTYAHESDTRRVVLNYAGGTEPLAKALEIIDPKHGNVVEEWLYDEDGTHVNSIRIYNYKFDKRGNWIEQRVTEREPASKRSAKPVWVAMRTITYYP
jgi:YD repeat-containing protein